MIQLSNTLHWEAERVPAFKNAVRYALWVEDPTERRRRADVLRKLADETEMQPWDTNPIPRIAHNHG